jgi:hypothetical protein
MLTDEEAQEWSDAIELDERLSQKELDEQMEDVARQDEPCLCEEVAEEHQNGLRYLMCQDCGSEVRTG